MRLELDSAAGRARCVGPNEATCRAAAALVVERAGLDTTAGPVDLDGRAAWLKASPLKGKSRMRHGFRHRVLRRPLPRAAEYRNLRWLQRHLFRVPAPLAAVSLWRGLLPIHQAVVLEDVGHAPPLSEALGAVDARGRAELLDELAVECARMHALGFAHRDLYLRNVLVQPTPEVRKVGGDPRRLLFIDAWSGGPLNGTRGAPRDLACLMLEGANLLKTAEQHALWERYLAERHAQGKPARPAALAARIEVQRERMLRRIAREPGRWRLAEPPAAWSPPV